MTSDRLLVGITQRVVEVPEYGEFRDCLDQAWIPFLDSLSISVVPIPNRQSDVARYCTGLGLDGFVLTGGNDLSLNIYGPGPTRSGVAPTRDATEVAILDYAADRNLPVLGICRGLQLMQAYFGGKLIAVGGGAVNHVAATHSVSVTCDVTAAETILVNSFHNYGIAADALAEVLEPLAVCSADGTVEAARHRDLPFVGIMWHPERASPEPSFNEDLIRTLFSGVAGDGA